jgi:hypothetical protein
VGHDVPQGGDSKFDFEDFICTCSEEGARAAEGLMAEVKKRLSENLPPIFPGEYVTDDLMLSAVVTSLSWSYRAHISKIICEQFSAVLADTDDGTLQTLVACDQVEHGVAATWKAFADHTTRRR